jgi:AcrR family transcriptional regulator
VPHRKRTGPRRRQPRQQRARQTVDAVLDSVARLLERRGAHAITTNRIAETAGVSIGSVYQYFPNKQAIYVALLARHLEEIERIVEAKLAVHEGGSLEKRIRALVEAMVDAHAHQPALYDLLFAQVPHRTEADLRHEIRMRAAFHSAIAPRSEERPRARGRARDVDRTLFVLMNMVEALSHAAVLRRPAGLSLAAATDEAVRAVLAYLDRRA